MKNIANAEKEEADEPLPKRKMDSSVDSEAKEQTQSKKQRVQSEVAGPSQVPGALSSATMPNNTNTNAVSTSILNPLEMTNPAAFIWGLLQSHQAGLPLPSLLPPQVTAALQQSIFASMGGALGIPAIAMGQELGQGLGQVLAAGATIEGQDTSISTNMPNAQLFAFLQQQPVQQQPVQQQHQQGRPTSMAATVVTEESFSSSGEERKTLFLVQELRNRVSSLEAENARLKHAIELLEKKRKDRKNK